MKILKNTARIILFLALLVFVYILANLIYGTLTDFQPLKVSNAAVFAEKGELELGDSTVSIAIWNVGYCGQGKEMALFFDAGHFYTSGNKMKRQSKKMVDRNMNGIGAFLSDSDTDIYLLQEVDVSSTRSHYTNQMEVFSSNLSDYSSYYFPNYKVHRNPLPIFEFWDVYGKADSGLGTFSKYQASEAKRLQLPGEYEWPTRIFQLDRCIGYVKYKLKNGKELVVLNIHNSAYDEGGFMKKQEVAYFRKLVLSEYKKGNYVIAGGDWNQLPPEVSLNLFVQSNYKNKPHYNIDPQLMPEGWKWAYDPQVPTNRNAGNSYKKGETFVKLIDFFLVSPNIDVLEVKGVDMEFEFTDHQAVRMEVKLK